MRIRYGYQLTRFQKNVRVVCIFWFAARFILQEVRFRNLADGTVRDGAGRYGNSNISKAYEINEK